MGSQNLIPDIPRPLQKVFLWGTTLDSGHSLYGFFTNCLELPKVKKPIPDQICTILYGAGSIPDIPCTVLKALPDIPRTILKADSGPNLYDNFCNCLELPKVKKPIPDRIWPNPPSTPQYKE